MRPEESTPEKPLFLRWRGIWLGVVWCCLIVGRACADDYFDRITTASSGRLTRFNRNVIMVYSDEIPLAAEQAKPYQETLIQALNLWEKAVDGQLQFLQAPAAVAADIRVRWMGQQSRWEKTDNIGEAMLIRKPEGFHIEIEIFLRDQTTLKLLQPSVVQTALLHEIGHAIGLWGHSKDSNDVMYFAATAKAPTARDVATWLKVRATPIDTPFHEQAIRALKSDLQKNPEVALNHYLIGMVYADEGDYRSAIDAFQRALAIDPLFRTSAVQLAQIYQQQGMSNLAIQHYTRALQAQPSAEVLGALGTLSLLQGKFDRAVEFFQGALRLAPNSAVLDQNLLAAYHRWGFQLLKANQFPEAIGCLHRGLAQFPFSEILLYDLAVTHESAGEYQNALEVYQRILRINPTYASAKIGMATVLNNLGTQYADNKDWEQALAYYRQALGYDPQCQQARQNLEATLMQLGWEKSRVEDLDGAMQTYRKLLEMAPGNPQAHNNLGIIYFKKRDYEKAVACFTSALDLDASYEEAQANLNYIRRQRTYDEMKRALGPVLLVLLVSFIIMKVNAKPMDNRR